MTMVDSGQRVAAMPEPLIGFGTLVLDARGVVVKCSEAAVRMFGGEPRDLEGGVISSFVTNLIPSDASPSYHARYMAYLTDSGLWRRFQAIDIHGQHFAVEIAMSRVAAADHHFLLLNLRLPLTD